MQFAEDCVYVHQSTNACNNNEKRLILGPDHSFMSGSETAESTLISLLIAEDSYFDDITLQADGNARRICRGIGDTVKQCFSSLATLRYMDSRNPQLA